jgi:hypothetical protein
LAFIGAPYYFSEGYARKLSKLFFKGLVLSFIKSLTRIIIILIKMSSTASSAKTVCLWQVENLKTKMTQKAFFYRFSVLLCIFPGEGRKDDILRPR